MLLDANVLLYAVDRISPHHERARTWLEQNLSSDARIALPWQTIGAVLRIATHPRVMRSPMTAHGAWEVVQGWLALPNVWVPPATDATARILGRLVLEHHIAGNLVPDAQLAALALENGIPVVSTDTDFGRFPEVRVVNPLTDRP